MFKVGIKINIDTSVNATNVDYLILNGNRICAFALRYLSPARQAKAGSPSLPLLQKCPVAEEVKI